MRLVPFPNREPAAPREAALPGERAHLAPIINLEDRRRPRQARTQREDDLEAQAVLGHAVLEGRLSTADLFAMVRLGIMTDQADLLPCADPHRRVNALDWERAYLRSRLDGEAGATGVPPSQVGCPIMARASGEAPPACIEALKARAQIPRSLAEGGLMRGAPDPHDEVVRVGLRPCLLLSRTLFRHLLVPLWEQDLK